ncbi:MAG: S41 family peptidase [Porphyromonadaceae bacterium]|nr:S41 family peptidase [Porphyromonadaceae bacterium]
MRDNGGGDLSTVQQLASRFTTEDFTSGYIRHKTGIGHNDFSDYYPITQQTAASNRLHFSKPVAILTNRRCYSATNNFVSVMSNLPQVCIIGDCTGGGSGLPFSSELPNGWVVRFSASPIYDTQKELTEFGIEPDIQIDLSEGDISNGIDSIIERAKQWILTNE